MSARVLRVHEPVLPARWIRRDIVTEKKELVKPCRHLFDEWDDSKSLVEAQPSRLISWSTDAVVVPPEAVVANTVDVDVELVVVETVEEVSEKTVIVKNA